MKSGKLLRPALLSHLAINLSRKINFHLLATVVPKLDSKDSIPYAHSL